MEQRFVGENKCVYFSKIVSVSLWPVSHNTVKYIKPKRTKLKEDTVLTGQPSQFLTSLSASSFLSFLAAMA